MFQLYVKLMNSFNNVPIDPILAHIYYHSVMQISGVVYVVQGIDSFEITGPCF